MLASLNPASYQKRTHDAKQFPLNFSKVIESTSHNLVQHSPKFLSGEHFRKQPRSENAPMRSNLLLKEFGTLQPNLEKSNPEFAYAECPIFLTPCITSSRVPRSSL